MGLVKIKIYKVDQTYMKEIATYSQKFAKRGTSSTKIMAIYLRYSAVNSTCSLGSFQIQQIKRDANNGNFSNQSTAALYHKKHLIRGRLRHSQGIHTLC